MIEAHHRQGGFVPPLGCSRRCKIKSVQTLLTTSTLRLALVDTIDTIHLHRTIKFQVF